MIVSPYILLRMKNVSDKRYREIQSAHFVLNNFFSFKNRTICVLDDVETYGTARWATGDNTVRRMRIECWIPMATDTHSEYIILIGLAQRHWLRERAPILSLYVH